ncbi:hypothetical protein AAU61_07100 [Desulfocarbo indianensis]|nr:hypothetical protein AAU61_07100 [Desulfocarbo indianensis]
MTPARQRLTAGYWEKLWQELREESCFQASQADHPQRWRDFYDQTAGLWEEATGGGEAAAQAVARGLASQGLAGVGASVLELGCGAGSLALALAARGARVTALDDSPGMLAELERRAAQAGLDQISAQQGDWLAIRPEDKHDLALAAFFPPACTPQGIERLESMPAEACALVVGTGGEVFPIRRRIWERVMETPLPGHSFNLPCAMGYLLASGRRPNLLHLSWQANLNLEAGKAAQFFAAYFAIFGKKGPGLRQAIHDALAPHARRGIIDLQAEASAALIHWAKASGR